MQYSPPNDVEMDTNTKPSSPPAYEASTAPRTQSAQPPRMVTPLTQVGSTPVDVDCPYCRKVVRTNVRTVATDNSGMMQCLICLVCWPMLFCYETEKDIYHFCSAPGCGKQLTHQAHGGQPQPVANSQVQPKQVASQYTQS